MTDVDWIAAAVDHIPRDTVDALSDALWDAGAAGIEEQPATGHTLRFQQPWDDGPAPAPPEAARLIAWFDGPDTAAVEDAVRSVLPSAHVGWSRDGADTDWDAVWRAGFEVVRIGPITIAPPWEAVPDAIIVEPGTGFGTGAHPTTRQALALLVEAFSHAPPPATVLDVGCGSGVLSLAAARLGATVRGIDIAPEAIEDAHRQAARNGISLHVDTTPLHAVGGRWDAVVANVHAEALVAMASDLLAHTGHMLIVAGILEAKEASVRAAFDPHLGEPTARRVSDGWIALAWRR